MVDGVRRIESSVEEKISDELKKAFKFDICKFSSSGREDVDVRMLGKGRPFMFEVVNSRKTLLTNKELGSMQDNINQSTNQVHIRDLQVIKK